MKKQALQTKRPIRTVTAGSKVPRPPKLKPPVQRPQALSIEPTDSLSYWHKYRWFVLSFFAAIVVFVGCSWLVYKQLLDGKDYYLFRLINNWPERLHIGFAVLTALGSLWAAAVIVVTIFVLRLYQLALRLALSICSLYGLLFVFKEIFARARPEVILTDIHIRAVETSFAFPSAHTAVATVLALSLRTYLPMSPIWQWFTAILWIGGVGLSRLYLGVHTPLDVTAGFALGVGVVSFWQILPTPIKKLLHLK